MMAKAWVTCFLTVVPLVLMPGCDVVGKLATPPTRAAQKGGEGTEAAPAEAAKATGSAAGAARKAREAAEEIDRAAAEAQKAAASARKPGEGVAP